jgi:hypothetical protein
MQYMIVHYVLVGLVLVVLVCLLLRNVHDAHNAPFRVGGVGLQRERGLVLQDMYVDSNVRKAHARKKI